MSAKIPKTNPELFNKLILLPNLYTGPDGTGEIVGEEDDLVIDYSLGFFRVVSVNDNISELRPWAPPKTTTIRDDLGKFGLLNSESENFLLFNPSTTPYRVSIPSSVTFAGSQVKYAKLFLGTDISDGGTVISTHYENGEYISENVPMERVIVSDHTNDCLKTMKESFVNTRLKNNERVTLVVYSESGLPTDIREFRAFDSNHIRSLTIGQSYVTGVELNSSFFSDSDSSLLEIPMDLSLAQMDLTATVRYRNEETRTLPIDGNKVRLDGVENYLSNADGKRAKINLVYRLDEGEFSLNANGDNVRFVNEKYSIVTKETEGNYTVKLFAVPHWVNDDVGYELEYYLYDLNRGKYYYATPYVEMGANSQTFKPKQYGVEQWLTLVVDINKVNPNNKPYRHRQKIAVSLLTSGQSSSTPWLIRYEDDGQLEYGHNLSAKVVYQGINDYRIRIDNNITDTASFLNTVYYRTKPLINTSVEKSAPAPTHFILNVGGVETEHVLSEWNNTIQSAYGGSEGKSILIHWLRKIGSETLHLGLSPMMIRAENASVARFAGNQYQAQSEKLINSFLNVPDNIGKVSDFDQNTTIQFNEDGTYQCLWSSDIDRDGLAIPNTGYVGEWITGERDVSTRYQISVAVVSRWKSNDGLNQIELVLNDQPYAEGTPVDITGKIQFGMRSDYEPSTAEISLSVAITNKENKAISVIDTITVTKN